MKLLVVLALGFFISQMSFAQNPQTAAAPAQSEDVTRTNSKDHPKADAADATTLLKKPDSLHLYSAKSIEGKLVNLADYKGKVLMVVNVASKCGFTSQYKELETLFRKYKDKGFVVLGFPSNDFGGQEPGSNHDIAKFCKVNYDVTFPLFEKLPVKGPSKQPVYKFLTEQSGSAEASGEIAWNFVKFIINKDGQVAARFSSSTKPLDQKVTAKIEELLK